MFLLKINKLIKKNKNIHFFSKIKQIQLLNQEKIEIGYILKA
jgi:hypothetical protein